MITIDTIIINDIHELADLANSMYHNVVSYDNLNSIAIVAKYYEAKTLIETLIAERGLKFQVLKNSAILMSMDIQMNILSHYLLVKLVVSLQKIIMDIRIYAEKPFMFLRIAILR